MPTKSIFHVARRLGAVIAACLLAGCASLDGQGDYWAVRSATVDGLPHLQTISHVNAGKPPRATPVKPVALRERHRGDVSVALRHDAAIAAAWAGSGRKFARELDKSLAWLQRLATPPGRKARLVVTLVGDARLNLMASHDASEGATIDLYVPVDPEAPSQSAAVGAALAIALHEAAHALQPNPARSRYQDEVRASRVGACYLLDTLRPGDVLHFRVDANAAPTNHYAATQSRLAAAAVMRELRRHAGADSVRVEDADARSALMVFCTSALAPALSLSSFRL